MNAQLTVLAFRTAARATQALPPSVAGAVGRAGGRVAAWSQPDKLRMAGRHQSRVTGRRDPRAATRVFSWYGRYWIEMLRLPAEVRRGTVAANFNLVGYEHITGALEQGNGAILALPHLGGWEWAAAWMAEQGHYMLAVVEALDPPELLDWFAQQREAMGLEIVALGADVSKPVLRALRDNRIVCLLSDRDLTGDGVEVEFFGERTTLPAGPATLALRTGAALLPVAVYFAPGMRHEAIVQPAVEATRTGRLREDIARITQDLAREFELLIRNAPEQWHLLVPNWPSDRRSDNLDAP